MSDTESPDDALTAKLADLERQRDYSKHWLSTIMQSQSQTISDYNEWRRMIKDGLKRTNIEIDAVRKAIANRKPQPANETAWQCDEQAPSIWKINLHFVALARQQMKPAEFAKAWEWASEQARKEDASYDAPNT